MPSALYSLLRRALFTLPPEAAHSLTFSLVGAAGPFSALAARAILGQPEPRLSMVLSGMKLSSPVGLAAGLDKDGTLGRFWPHLGFGFVELGTVTAQAQSGNPRPRLFRLVKEEALINRMGFNNHGSYALGERLLLWRRQGSFPRVAVGVNLGKSKLTPLEEAAKDYAMSARRVAKAADYLVINVSSPNTPGLRQLQDAAALQEILRAVKVEAPHRPLFVKLSPDLTAEALRSAVEISEVEGAAGFIATNTTIERPGFHDVGPGGLSGRPLKEKALAVVRQIASYSQLPIIGVGGVSSAADVLDLLGAGASAVQLYTALIYQGPGLLREINRALIELMSREGLSDVDALREWCRAR